MIPLEKIERRIFLIRGKKVMLDADLAVLYGVETFRLNEIEVIANCDNLARLKFSAHLPCAFTELGVAMLSSVLNSERAILVNIQIMRAFSKFREMLRVNKDMWRKIEEMEKRYDNQFKSVFEVLRQLIVPAEKPKKRIGFHP